MTDEQAVFLGICKAIRAEQEKRSIPAKRIAIEAFSILKYVEFYKPNLKDKQIYAIAYKLHEKGFIQYRFLKVAWKPQKRRMINLEEKGIEYIQKLKTNKREV